MCGDAECPLRRMPAGVLGENHLEFTRQTHRKNRREAPQELCGRRGLPGIQGQQEVAWSDAFGDSPGIEDPAAPPGAHLHFANRSQAEIRKEIMPESGHADERKTGGKKSHQGAQGRKGEQMISDGISENYGGIPEASQ